MFAENTIIKALKEIGYEAIPFDAGADEEQEEFTRYRDLMRKFIVAGAAMALSSVTVVSNANRLRWFQAKGV